MPQPISICQEVQGRRLFGQSLAGAHLDDCDELSGSELDSCDLTRAILDGVRWSRSTFVRTDFSHASMARYVDTANTFRECKFIGTEFRAGTIGFEGTLFDACDFARAKFDRTTFVRPRFVGCSFQGKLHEMDFEASSFARCKFSGRIEGGWFRNGYRHPALLARFGPPTTNEMDHVDFRDAVLWGVTFSGNVDLSTVILPRDGEHYFFDEWTGRVQTVANLDPPDPQLKAAVSKFAKVFGPSATEQNQFIVYRGFLAHSVGEFAANYILEQLLRAG